MRRARGFTLLEILIVVVLMAILTAAAINTINFVVEEADAETEAERFAALSALAAEEAVLTGREYGLRLDDENMHFLLFDEITGQWQAFEDERVFRSRPLPESLDFELVLEGQALALGDTDAQQDEPDGNSEKLPEPPQLIFLSSGEITPFTLTVTEQDGETWVVEGDLLGRMEIRNETQ